jgi:hypothetical protein
MQTSINYQITSNIEIREKLDIYRSCSGFQEFIEEIEIVRFFLDIQKKFLQNAKQIQILIIRESLSRCETKITIL